MHTAVAALNEALAWLRADHEKLVRRIVELETWIHTLQQDLERHIGAHP